MFAHPGVVRGSLDREIERHFQSQPRRSAHKPPEISQAAKLGVDGAVTALDRTDRLRTTRVSRLGNSAVVPALAVDAADRMDWHKVDDVETKPRYLGQTRDAVIEGGAFPRHLSLTAGEHLIPRGKACRRAIDNHLQFAGIAHCVAAR